MNSAANVSMRKSLSFILLLSAAAVWQPLKAATFDVNTTQDAPASAAAISQGVCDDGLGQCTLRAAIQVANAVPDASTINVPAGTYTLTVTGVDEAPAGSGANFSVDHTPDASIGDLNITQNISIVGAGAGLTVVGWAAGAQDDRVFHIEVPSTATTNISVSIQGVTVENGYLPAPVTLDDSVPNAVIQFVRSGGGIAIGAGAAVVTVNPNATHGQGGGGGGGSEGHGGPGESESGATIEGVTLSDVQIISNQAGGDGGGLYNTAPLTIDNAVITGNTSAANGGGVYNDAAMTMSDTTIGSAAAPNDAENGGGMFETGFHTSFIQRTTITGNTAIGGAGIAGRRLVLENITNSTIANNTARDTGGGITTNGRVVLTNVTVAGNTVSSTTEGGGAGLNGFGPASGGSAGSGANASNYTLVNTIVANNTLEGTTPVVSNCGGTGEGDPTARFFSLGHNLEDANTCGLSATGDLTGVDPLLQPLADNGGPTLTMAIDPASPAVDAGDDSACPNNDQRGQLRPADGNVDNTFQCDIGAYELFVPAADLHINNMTAPDTVYTNDSFDVTVEVHIDPAASTPSTGVQIVTGTLPAGLTLTSATVTTPAGTQDCTQSAGVVTCDAGTLAPDDTAAVDLKGSAANPSPSLTISATASQSSPADPDSANNTAHVHIAVVGESNLGITSSGTTGRVAVGESSDMSFSVSNAGPNDATSVRIGMELPDNVTFKAVGLPGATCSYDDSAVPSTVLCTLDTLAAGAVVNGTLSVTGATAGQATTTFAADAYQRDTNLTNNQSNTTLTIWPVAVKGSGCTVNPNGGFDPTLIGLLIAGLAGVYISNTRRARRQ